MQNGERPFIDWNDRCECRECISGVSKDCGGLVFFDITPVHDDCFSRDCKALVVNVGNFYLSDSSFCFVDAESIIEVYAGRCVSDGLPRSGFVFGQIPCCNIL